MRAAIRTLAPGELEKKFHIRGGNQLRITHLSCTVTKRQPVNVSEFDGFADTVPTRHRRNVRLRKYHNELASLLYDAMNVNAELSQSLG